MVTTKHCCWGNCKSDSRNRLSDNLYFIGFGNGFPKPNKGPEERMKCTRWAANCGRKFFTVNNVTKDTYICSMHFVGGNGPTLEYPDPVRCGKEVVQKRKAPASRQPYKSAKQQRLDMQLAAEGLLLLPTCDEKSEEREICVTAAQDEASDCAPITASVSTQHSPIMVDKQCQSEPQLMPDVLKLKIENKILENDLKLKNSEFEIRKPSKKPTNVSSDPVFHQDFGFESAKDDDKSMKFYTGLTCAQFMCLWSFLGSCTKKVNYWNSSVGNEDKTPSKRPGPRRKLSPINELFLTLVRLRLGLLHQDLAYRFNTNTRHVSTIVLTWTQLLFKHFSALRKVMFASRQTVKKHLPKCFKKYKNLRCIIDCTEVHVQQPKNFEAQGNQYSSYKGHTTYKFLVAIAPNGAIQFVSDAYEGSISDKEIVKQSGFLDYLEPGDVVMADRGFLIEEMLNERFVKLIMPPFLGSRQRFTPQEEALTKDIAKHRIHVERSIERIKKFRMMQKVIPQTLRPVFSQIVFVVACLVNFQPPIVK